MGYCVNDSIVRVDFFKPSGKWYTNEAIKFCGYDHLDIHEAFKNSIKLAVGNKYSGMTAVCLHPYHEYTHPLMLILD